MGNAEPDLKQIWMLAVSITRKFLSTFSFFKKPPLSKQTDQGNASLLGGWSQTDFQLFLPISVWREAWPFVNYESGGKNWGSRAETQRKKVSKKAQWNCYRYIPEEGIELIPKTSDHKVTSCTWSQYFSHCLSYMAQIQFSPLWNFLKGEVDFAF